MNFSAVDGMTKRVMQQFHLNREILNDVLKQLENIQQNNVHSVQDEPEKFRLCTQLNLPLNTVDELQELENFLKEERNFKSTVSFCYLASIYSNNNQN